LDSAKKLAHDAKELLKEVREMSEKKASEKKAKSEESSPVKDSKFMIMRKAPSSWRRDGSEEPLHRNGSQTRY
jgi:hypothetical protein